MSAFRLAVVALLLGVLAQHDLSSAEIRSVPVAGAVHMIEGQGGNIGVSVGPDGMLIIDDQFAPLADKIRGALGKLGQGKLRFVINTHWHGDHTGGNVVFGNEATIIAHDNVRQRLSTPQDHRGMVREPLPRHGLPVVTFDDVLTMHFNDEEIRVVHYPRGHTDGDSVVFFERSKVVHMGDLFFAGRFPLVDLDSGGDVEGYARNVASILEGLGADVKIIPGHGPLASRDNLVTFSTMLSETIDTVRRGMAEGKGLPEIQQAGLPARWQGWGSSFVTKESWTATIFRSLSAARTGT